MSEIYKFSAIQSEDVSTLTSDLEHCNLFDPYTPFNCISCHKGYALNIQTKKCQVVANEVDHCEEYVSFAKDTCIRCATGYVLDYGINTDLFNSATKLSKRRLFGVWKI